MLKTYKIEQGRIVEAPDGPIYLFVEPTSEEKAQLVTRFKIDEHNLTSAMDPNELPRLELEEDHLALIFKAPKSYTAADNFVFRINSLGLFLYQDKLVVVAPPDFSELQGRAFTKVQNLAMLFLRLLSVCVSHFISHLQVINEIASELEGKILKSMENRHLLLMFTIEKSLVYYINAISANGRVVERLKANAKNAQTGGLSPEMLEYVDDLAIENAQCLEQAQVYANVFTGLMNARASIVSNNLNVLMKSLTVINVVFMPLNVLAGVGGMSEFSMMTKNIPWPLAYSAFMLGLTAIGWITYYILVYMEKRTFGK
ncbi:MAG: magnesium transporter CorA family protein [Verrucomicrobiota bacterium]|jgi:magnesium transporter